MSMVRIKRLRENAVLPTHGSAYAAGYDLCACLDGDGAVVIPPHHTVKIGTGLASAFIGWGLAIGKYEGALTVQPASAITAEVILRFAVPIVMSLISIVCMLFWDMDKQLAKKD